MLSIEHLHVAVDDKSILRGINLTIQAGQVHAIMGPNGSGKSTLSHTLAGRDGYVVTQGSIQYKGEDLLKINTETRAVKGIFLAFQYPVVLPGVTNVNFLKESVNTIRRARNQQPLDAIDFLSLVRQKLALLDMDETLLYRAVNDGFSGGEKKRNEILQMLLLEPDLIILDETDSGLDIDALKMVAKGVNAMRSANRAILVVTHYQRLLDYIVPDFVHVMMNGQIIRTGDKGLALELEQKGYGWVGSSKAVVNTL